MTIIDHFERHLGKIHTGWRNEAPCAGIQIGCFLNQPSDGVTTYATLGLSKHVLAMGNGRTVRQEFLLPVSEAFSADEVASFLLTFSEYIVSKKQALLRGDVIGPSAPLIDGVRANAVYAAIPICFEDAFATYRHSAPATVLVWLVPILETEAEFVRMRGWSDFEDVLERANPDLWNLGRKAIDGV